MRQFTQMKFMFYSEIINREYARLKRAERARLHEAVKLVQEKRRMDNLITSIQLHLCFECPDTDNLWWNRICGFRNEMLKTARNNVRRKEDAEDIVQNALIKAHENRDKFREDANLKGWLCTITKNMAINHYRKEQRKPTVYAEDVSDLCDKASDNLVESFSVIGDINYAMSKLPEVTRSVYEMRLKGHSLKEIRTGVDRSMSAVERHLGKAKKEMKIRLSEYQI
jgi:RNA polymerase sigma factor (sigma-70 family)